MTLLKSCFCSASVLFSVAAPSTFAADEIIQAAAVSSDHAPEKTALATVVTHNEPHSNAPFLPLIKGPALDGWQVQEGKANAWRRDGEMISCLSSTGGWLRTDAEYSDFVLKLEYRLQSGGNTGIGLRSPAAGNPTFTGIEIQLLDDTSPKYTELRADQYTGSVYYQVPAIQKAKLNPLNEWNQCEIRCLGDELTVIINGEVVNQVQLSKSRNGMAEDVTAHKSHLLSQRPPLGHLALQSHSTRVDFRKIEVQDLTHSTPSGLKFVDLLPGTGELVGDAKSVTLHYVGQLVSGKRFTDTRDVGSPVEVPLDGVIPGLQEGIQGMKVNGRRRMIVPAHLGYGSQGISSTIPGDATLVFEVEVSGVTR